MPLQNLMEKWIHLAYPNWDFTKVSGLFMWSNLFSCGTLSSRVLDLMLSLLFPLNFLSQFKVLGQVLSKFCGFSWKGKSFQKFFYLIGER